MTNFWNAMNIVECALNILFFLCPCRQSIIFKQLKLRCCQVDPVNYLKSMNTQLTAAWPRVYTYLLLSSILSSLLCRFCTFETFFLSLDLSSNTVFLCQVVYSIVADAFQFPLNPSIFFSVSKGCDYRKPKVLFTFYHKCVCHHWRCFYGQYYAYLFHFSTLVREQCGLIGVPFCYRLLEQWMHFCTILLDS